MKKIAVIPARGGSKRIPFKNIKLFCGKPIIAYSIQNAQACGEFDEIIVSTDDKEIANVARSYHAKVPFVRPSNLSLDTTPTLPVVKHAIEELKLSCDDLVCCIYPTAPLLQPSHLSLSLQKFQAFPKKYYIFSCMRFESSPWRGFMLEEKENEKNNTNNFEKISMLFPQHVLCRSQDLKEIYHDAGAFYWGKAKTFCEERMIFSSHSLIFILPRIFAQDIDTVDDWLIAEMKYRLKHLNEDKDIL